MYHQIINENLRILQNYTINILILSKYTTLILTYLIYCHVTNMLENDKFIILQKRISFLIMSQ